MKKSKKEVKKLKNLKLQAEQLLSSEIDVYRGGFSLKISESNCISGCDFGCLLSCSSCCMGGCMATSTAESMPY